MGIFFAGIISLFFNYLNKITVFEPKSGGSLKIGLACYPSYINPVLSHSNDCEKDLIELVYDGLYKIDGKGNLIPNLAEKTEISENGKTYTVFLKDNINWHDGLPLTADDVIFTIEIIQNPSYRSPLRINWEGVVVEKLSNTVVRFNLRKPYSFFIQNLTLKIIPKHYWENIEPGNIYGAEYNLEPVGSGPYLFDNYEKNKVGKILSYSLVANEKYFNKQAKINRLTFYFYHDYQKAKEALLKKEVEGLSPLLSEDIDFFKNKKNFKISIVYLPRYYSVFLNLNNRLFTEEFREALSLAIDRSFIAKTIKKGQAFPLNGPLSFEFLIGENEPAEYNPEKAKSILEKIDLKKVPNKEFKFNLFLPENEELIKVADYLVESWEKIGIKAERQIVPLPAMEKEIIRSRSYDAILFGQIVSQEPDFFSFWHSSQISDPGLNLSLYRNKSLDKLLEETRQILDQERRKENIKSINAILSEDKPAIFLYNPHYLLILPKKIKGNSIRYANFPSERFADIANWYIYTKRILK